MNVGEGGLYYRPSCFNKNYTVEGQEDSPVGRALALQITSPGITYGPLAPIGLIPEHN